MAEFIRVAKLSEIPDPGKLIVEVEDRVVVLVHVKNQVYCLDDVCTHDGGTLGDGQLCGYELACPRHGACFDVRNGEPLTMPATEPTDSHEVRLDGDDICVRLRDE